MGRKNILAGLMSPPAPAPAADSVPPAAAPAADPHPAPRAAKGAIGAVSRSIADLKARAVIEIDPHLIDAGGLQDRLESDNAEDEALARSLRDYGQQVPVLVRPHPDTEGRWQIVYGRRRVLAMRDIGQPVKALVRDMDDREVVLAQGQENTARRDLSFIEKANFARQMAAAGYDRRIICDALSIDKTVISRMLAVTDQVPVEVIEAVGAAPSVGRDRWLALAGMLEGREDDADTLIAMANMAPAAQGSDGRFQALLDYLSGSRQRRAEAARRAETVELAAADGRRLGSARRGARKTVIQINVLSDGAQFGDWLVENMTEIHRRWRDGE